MKLLSWFLTLLLFTGSSFALDLVNKSTVEIQKKLTTEKKLKHDIPLIYRNIPNSDILELIVTFRLGQKDLNRGTKTGLDLLFSTMTMAADKFPKAKVYELIEKYALSISCSSGIESSSCSLGTLNEHWSKALPLFAAIIKKPSLNQEDLDLQRQQLIAATKRMIEDPESYVNNVVNKVFYSDDHPYKQTYEDTLAEAPAVTKKNLAELHKKIVNATAMNFVVVGSLPVKEVETSLNKYFGDIAAQPVTHKEVPDPRFDHNNSYGFEDRDIPTAYIRFKFPAPGKTHQDSVATQLMLKVLSEELEEEVRTKKSLSYAVYSYGIQYSKGIGVISASTSKPQDTLNAIYEVVNKLKTKMYTTEELEEQKRVYATSYYLTQEEHASLAGALATSYFFHGTPNYLYEFPLKLSQVMPQDLQRVAKEYLVNFRVGVVFAKDKFNESWAKALITKSMRQS